MPHIVFISPYYPPEKGAAAICVSEHAKRLAKLGHQVTVLTTFPNYPTGIVPPEYRGRLIQCEMLDSVRVIRVWSYTSPNTGFLRRILAQFSFACLAPLLGRKEVGQPDVIIVQSPPLFDAIAGRMLAWRKRCPFIFMVSDLWPESAIRMGILRNRLYIRLSKWLEWSTYQRAAFVWVVTDAIRHHLIQRGLAPEHIILLNNGVDTIKFRPLSKDQARLKLGLGDHFLVIHAGTQGPSRGLTTLLDAAEHLLPYEDVHFLLVGDGAEKAELRAQAHTRGLKNVTFLDPLPHDDMPTLLAAADICLVHVPKVMMFQGTLPIKMFEAMACARPLVLAVDGEARKRVAEEAGAAIYVEPENASEIVSAILHLRAEPCEGDVLGQRGRAYAETYFDYDCLTETLHRHIERLLGNRNSASMLSMRIPVTPMAEKSNF